MLLHEKLYTANGEISEMVPTGGEHGEITFDFSLLNWIRRH